MAQRLSIRAATSEDWPALWTIIEPVFRAGETFPQARDITEAEARRTWLTLPTAAYTAWKGHSLLGTYYIKPNQPSRGAHVCNCGYVVAEAARGRGVGSALCRHSQREAVRLDFRSMQFNLVVATNEPSLRTWKRNGFDTVGRLPEAFHHPVEGYVDAFIMYKRLVGASL